jgi:hypothetical protein
LARIQRSSTSGPGHHPECNSFRVEDDLTVSLTSYPLDFSLLCLDTEKLPVVHLPMRSVAASNFQKKQIREGGVLLENRPRSVSSSVRHPDPTTLKGYPSTRCSCMIARFEKNGFPLILGFPALNLMPFRAQSKLEHVRAAFLWLNQSARVPSSNRLNDK